ncbi:phosphatidylinositol 4-kinase [Striga asiatica]|uniref:1-phosphatidylinositol 4-kinase n=1 Tax=Striga asiatica TaxID=4170 RepID=A0A5A7P9Z7_STRAF|nr:phosphatidylinositol 4-kinase [Striga asiatica]
MKFSSPNNRRALCILALEFYQPRVWGFGLVDWDEQKLTMVGILGLTRAFGDWADSPREVTRTIPTSENIGESGWLIRFFDSAFFCEWIAVSYLYKHDHSGVRDYLCNRMYTLPLSGIESYLFQICYMLIHKPSPSLDKFVIDVCSKSLKIALKVHWFLMAELEEVDDNEGVSRIQEKCQFAATLMGEWPPLIKPQLQTSGFMSTMSFGNDNGSSSSPSGKNPMLNRLLSSKQKLMSLTSSPPNATLVSKSFSFSPSSGNSITNDDGGKVVGTPEENNKIFKKFIPGPKVRDALLFRKSLDKDEEVPEKDGGFLKRLLRDSRDDDARKSVGNGKENDEDPEKESGFFKRLLRDNRDEGMRKSVDRSKDEEWHEQDGGFFKRLLTSSREEDSRKSMDRNDEEFEKDGFFRRLLSGKDEEEGINSSTDSFIKRLFRDGKNDSDEKALSKSAEDEEKEGFFKKLFKDKNVDKNDGNDKNDDDVRVGKNSEDEGFFKKLFKEKFDDKKDASERVDENRTGHANSADDDPPDSLLRRLFRVHPEDSKTSTANDSSYSNNLLESSPGTENFFRKLFKDRDRSVEDSELYGSKMSKANHPGSPKQGSRKSHAKPPLPNSVSQLRKGTYHESLDFVQSLCETSYGLVDVFPIEDRKTALRESLAEINEHIDVSQSSGGICFPMGKGMYRVVQIPVDEAVLMNSREKAPYLICIEVLKCEAPSNSTDASNSQKLSRGGIPLANRDALLPKPPPWAYPLWTGQDMYHSGYDRMSRSTSDAIDQAMAQLWDAKVKFVHVNFSVEKQSEAAANCGRTKEGASAFHGDDSSDLEFVRVILSAEPGSSMDDILDQDPPRRKEHRRVPSTVAIEEVKAAALKGEAPPGLPLKGAGQDSSDAQPKVENGGVPKVGDALAGELWAVKKERIRKASVYGKLPGWDLRSAIVKSGDDCRQEHLAVQLIYHFYGLNGFVGGRHASGCMVLYTESKALLLANLGTLDENNGGCLSEQQGGLDCGQKAEELEFRDETGKFPPFVGHELAAGMGWFWKLGLGNVGNVEPLEAGLGVYPSPKPVVHRFSGPEDIFQEAGLPLWLRPYEVLVTFSYTALIETIPDTASLHSIKSRFPNISSLRDFFVAKYQENSPAFKLAQRNFVESMAGYSLVCYLLQVKDRHNGNLLLDEEGHIIHIDFGFMLSNSPGGVNFESAPFKLTRELLEVMDSDAEGVPSEFFDYFKVLCIQGFLTCRKHAERIILLVEMLQDSGFPCFKGGPRTIQNLRKRFHLGLTEEQCVSLVLSLISSSLDAWRTRQYDYYQRVLNGIFYLFNFDTFGKIDQRASEKFLLLDECASRYHWKLAWFAHNMVFEKHEEFAAMLPYGI